MTIIGLSMHIFGRSAKWFRGHNGKATFRRNARMADTAVDISDATPIVRALELRDELKDRVRKALQEP